MSTLKALTIYIIDSAPVAYPPEFDSRANNDRMTNKMLIGQLYVDISTIIHLTSMTHIIHFFGCLIVRSKRAQKKPNSVSSSTTDGHYGGEASVKNSIKGTYSILNDKTQNTGKYRK